MSKLTDIIAANGTSGEATYCPEDNKLRLYVGRVPRDEYDALRREGWTATPKQSEAGQGEFAATWTTEREDTALSYSGGYIGDEDAGPGERAADRAERFGGYLEKRAAEAGEHADRYDGQDAAHGYQNADRAERAAARHDRIADRACNSWEKAEYWTRRTAGVIAHALYVSGPGVRMGRIKVLEAEQRKEEKAAADYARRFRLWTETAAEQEPAMANKMAYLLANSSTSWSEYRHPRPDKCTDWHRNNDASLYSLMTDEKDPITGHEAAALWLSDHTPPNDGGGRWARHYAFRLAYERQMLEAQGGTLESNLTDIEPGGWLGKRQVQSVHKSNATGRVSSVKVWGTTSGYTKESGYKTHAEWPCLVKVDVERLPPGSYRPPTDEERAAFLAEKKAAKAERGVIPTINPTREDAERLQAQINAKEIAATKGNNYPHRASEIEEMTQAEYSGSYKDDRTVREFAGVVKVRIRSHGWQYAPRVVILTDKPQKPFPPEVWETAQAEKATAAA